MLKGSISSPTGKAMVVPDNTGSYSPVELDSATWASMVAAGWSLTAGDVGPFVNNTGSSQDVVLVLTIFTGSTAGSQLLYGASVNGADPVKPYQVSGTATNVTRVVTGIVTVPNGGTVWPYVRSTTASTVNVTHIGAIMLY